MPEVVGVVIVGHGRSAGALLDAATGVVGAEALAGVVAIDAGVGQTADLEDRLHAAVAAADAGAGVLLVADVLGASPCTCGIRQAMGHRLAVLAGLNLAMLLKLATLDRAALSPAAIAQACAESARRAVLVQEPELTSRPSGPEPSQSPPAREEPG
jgi:mannose PTS system EIIA component